MADEDVSARYHYDSWDVKFDCAFEFPESAAMEAIALLKACDGELWAEWRDGLLRLSCESGGDLHELAETLASVMQRQGLEEPILLQASYSSSGNYPCRHGGLAAAVGAGDFRIEDTRQLASRLAQEVRMARLACEFERKYPGKLERMLNEMNARLEARKEREI